MFYRKQPRCSLTKKPQDPVICKLQRHLLVHRCIALALLVHSLDVLHTTLACVNVCENSCNVIFFMPEKISVFVRRPRLVMFWS